MSDRGGRSSAVICLFIAFDYYYIVLHNSVKHKYDSLLLRNKG